MKSNPATALAGFVRRDEHTSDVVRWVWYEKTIDSFDSQVRLILQVELELSISDNPVVKTCDNFSYSFNGVYLKVIEPQMEKWDTQAEDKVSSLSSPHIPPLDVLVDEEPREIGRFELRVSTLAQLRSLSKMLGAR
jgi:hypothetical protein